MGRGGEEQLKFYSYELMKRGPEKVVVIVNGGGGGTTNLVVVFMR